MFLLVPAYPGCPGQTAVKWLLLLLPWSKGTGLTCQRFDERDAKGSMQTFKIPRPQQLYILDNIISLTELLLLLLHHLTAFFSRTTWVSQYQKSKTSLDLNEARDDGVLECSGVSWTICKQSAPCSRHITTSTPHYSFFQAGCSS